MKRGTQLRRKSPLRRKTRLRSRGDNGYRNRSRDWAYMAWVRHQPCAVSHTGSWLSPCQGRVEADHAGKKPAGWRKAPDRTCIPLCKKHHRQRDTFAGIFRDWTGEMMREWLDGVIAQTQAEYGRRK